MKIVGLKADLELSALFCRLKPFDKSFNWQK